jgi:pteridine reductase
MSEDKHGGNWPGARPWSPAARAARRGARQAFHGAGANVVIHYRGSQRRRRGARRDGSRPGAGRARPRWCRATCSTPAALPGMVERAAAAFGGLDILVNNASSFYPTPVGQITAATGTSWSAATSRRRCSCRRRPCPLAAAPRRADHQHGGHPRAPAARRPPGLLRRQGGPGDAHLRAGARARPRDPRQRHRPRRVAGVGRGEDEKAATSRGFRSAAGGPEDIAACALYLAGAGSHQRPGHRGGRRAAPGVLRAARARRRGPQDIVAACAPHSLAGPRTRAITGPPHLEIFMRSADL